jgi:PilZ domain
MRTDKDKRKTKRQSMRYTAWISPEPGKSHGCVLSDISETGARIRVEDADAIPDSFMLLLARNGRALRPCRVKWRKPNQIGVTFVTHLAIAASDAPEQKADTEVAAPPLAPEAKAEPKPAPADKA